MLKQNATQEKLTRIAIVNLDRCKPKRCRQECKKSCPVVRQGKLVNRPITIALSAQCFDCSVRIEI